MSAYQVLVGAFTPGEGWSAFSVTHIVGSAAAARNQVLGHPDAAAGQWRVIRVDQVETFPLSVAS